MEPAKTQATSRVGKYKLVERLAIGGMAEVFLACERGARSLDRLVVIKRILPHLAEDEAFVDMFLQEARVAARITHPNVVGIYELGDAGGFPYIAMEYVPGSTFKELLNAARINEVRLTVPVVVDLLDQALAGAHAAHELRDAAGNALEVVHRDLSPHNLMVTEQGLVKLVDFGIAKLTNEGETTRTGMLKGKISYMSPEQCRQERVDRRTDIFALGIVCWELLAGQKLFAGMTELATMQAIVTGDLRDISSMRDDVPEAIRDVIGRALATNANDRWESAEAFRRALLAAAASSSHLVVDRDKTALLVQTLLGDVLSQRRADVTQALERTLVTLSAVQPGDDDRPSPVANSNSSLTHGGATMTRSAQTVASPIATAFGGFAVGATAVFSMIILGLSVLTSAYWFDLLPSLTPEAPAAAPRPMFAGDIIEIAVAPTFDAAVLLQELTPLEDYLTLTLSRTVRFTAGDSYVDAADRVINGEAPFALLPHRTVEYAQSKDALITVLATEVVDGSRATAGLLLVRSDSNIRDASDLRGQTICYSDNLSHTGYALPRQWLVSKGLDPDADLVSHFSGDHEQVLRDLLSGVCNVGGTYNGNYSTAVQRGIPASQLDPLAKTGSTPHDGFVASSSADPALQAALKAALLAFEPTQHLAARHLGDNKRVTGYVEPDGARGTP